MILKKTDFTLSFANNAGSHKSSDSMQSTDLKETPQLPFMQTVPAERKTLTPQLSPIPKSAVALITT